VQTERRTEDIHALDALMTAPFWHDREQARMLEAFPVSFPVSATRGGNLIVGLLPCIPVSHQGVTLDTSAPPSCRNTMRVRLSPVATCRPNFGHKY
jgi:hypothetical protein